MLKLISFVKTVIYYSVQRPYYKLIFGGLGSRSRIFGSPRLENPQNIFIGNKVTIGRHTWLAASPHVAKNPVLKIGDGCSIGSMNQIYSTTSIILEKKVLTADRVYISDSTHEYRDISTAIMDQEVLSLGEIVIGEGSWIGTNACIMGVSVGKHCIIGANTIVNRNVPDYCVVAGNPGRIIKRYDPVKKIWEKQ